MMIRPRALAVLCFVSAAFTLGCSDGYAEQVDLCERSMQEQPGLNLLLGSEGTTALCSCTVDSLAVRFPDAADRWVEYSMNVESRLERRGVLGMVLDTAWQSSEGRAITEFAAAHGEVIASCGKQLVGDWSRFSAPAAP